MSFKVATLIRYELSIAVENIDQTCCSRETMQYVLLIRRALLYRINGSMRINILSLMAANMSLRRMILTGLQHTIAFMLGKLRLSQPFAR